MTKSTALQHIRICDFSGLLAGAGATKFLSAFGAEIIRVEDPVRQGRWDILRGGTPYKDERRGINLGGSFNNHNVEKLGVTINLKHELGLDLARKLIAVSDVVHENFAPGVLDRLGLGFDAQKEIKPDIIYVTNTGFGHSGPYGRYKSFGPIAQAAAGLTFASGLPDLEPAGYGYSYMDHTGAYFGAMAIMLALYHRNATGEGQYVDVSAAEAGAVLNGPELLDYTVNNRPSRRPGRPDTNHSQFPQMAPHNIYEANGDDEWIAIACRSDADWQTLAALINAPWTEAFDTLEVRVARQDQLDTHMTAWTRVQNKIELADQLVSAGVPASPVRKPQERVDEDPNTQEWGLWPTVKHSEMGDVRVDGIGVHLSEPDWSIERGAPCLGENNHYVFSEVLGLSAEAIETLRAEGAI
ncbi:MAG: CoA transferase [Gammaproteobacteria bacterium]|nr:CoA transferase [Gammaproteobacteria bacterium]